jgi:hypothetical protein
LTDSESWSTAGPTRVGPEDFPYVTVPAEARERPCNCGGEHFALVDRRTLHVDESTGKGHVGWWCPNNDGGFGPGGGFFWDVPADEYRATFEHDLEG